MNVYCDETLISKKREKREIVESGSVAPLVSIHSMQNDYQQLCNIWNLPEPIADSSSSLKKSLKKRVRKAFGWLFEPAISKQREFNLSVVHLMDSWVKQATHMQAYLIETNTVPTLFVCRDSIVEASRLQEIILAFQYYKKHYSNNAYLIFLNEKVEDTLYYQLLQRTMYELQMTEVRFIISSDSAVVQEYLSMAKLIVSFKDKEEFENDQLTLQYSTSVKECKKNTIVVDEIDIEEIASMMAL